METVSSLFFSIVQNVALVGIAAYLTTRLPAVRRALTASCYKRYDKAILALVFGGFSILGNWLAIPVMGSIANSRIVGPVVGGLLGGPVVGMVAGVLGCIPRYFRGGFTMEAAITATIVAGIISGYVHRKYGTQRINLKVALATGLACEAVLKGFVLLFSKPFSVAWELEKIIAVPTATANTLAVGLFIYIIRDVFAEQEKAQAQSAQQIIRMLRHTSGFLQDGLSSGPAKQVAEIIYKETRAAAIAITNVNTVLAFVGEGADHHVTGMPILTVATKQVLEKGRALIVNSKEELGCPYDRCSLTAVVDVPLVVSGELMGSIKLYKKNNELISPYEAELIQGIADFLSLQLAQRKLKQQQMLLVEAEYSMLKAQINPHFLFNTLGTIRAMTRISPKGARTLIKDLSVFLRKTLKREEEMTTVKEEMEIVKTYLRIERERFRDRIHIVEDIPETLLNCCIPVFSLQPLVENAIKHGLSPKIEGGTILIRAWSDQTDLYLLVQDEGVGIPPDKILTFNNMMTDVKRDDGLGIGLINIHRRLQLLYGRDYGLRIVSETGKGAKVTICLPNIRKEEKRNATL